VVSESSQGINFCDVLDIRPDELAVIIRGDAPHWCSKITLDKRAFGRFKFDCVKWIRQRTKPEDRCWYFETLNESGVWSLDKERALIESRKTRTEKEDEKKEEHELRELMKKYGFY